MLMHPKDKMPTDQKKDVVYFWECQADGCKSSYVGETSTALGERVKEHCKSSTSAILKHCTDHHHPLPSITNFNIIDKDPSQITQEAKEAYTFEGWTLISIELLVKCLSHTTLTT